MCRKKFVKKIGQNYSSFIHFHIHQKICQKLHHKYTYLKEAQESNIEEKGQKSDKQRKLGS